MSPSELRRDRRLTSGARDLQSRTLPRQPNRYQRRAAVDPFRHQARQAPADSLVECTSTPRRRVVRTYGPAPVAGRMFSTGKIRLRLDFDLPVPFAGHETRLALGPGSVQHAAIVEANSDPCHGHDRAVLQRAARQRTSRWAHACAKRADAAALTHQQHVGIAGARRIILLSARAALAAIGVNSSEAPHPWSDADALTKADRRRDRPPQAQPRSQPGRTFFRFRARPFSKRERGRNEAPSR